MKKHYFYTLIALLFTLTNLYYLSDDSINDYVIAFCLLIFYLIFFDSFNTKIKVYGIASFIKVDTFFLIFFYILYYLPYQLYLVGLADLNYNKYLPYLFLEYVNKSMVLSTIGLVSFYFGYKIRFNAKRNNNIHYDTNFYRLFPGFVVLLFYLVFIVFMLTGLQQLLFGRYLGIKVLDTTDGGIYVLTNFLSLLTLAASIYHYEQNRNISFLLLLGITLSALWMLLVLVIGDRNTFFLNAVMIIVGYSTVIRRIRLYQLVSLFLVALILYQAVEISRTSDNRSIGQIVGSIGDSESKFDYSDNSFSITTVGSRAAIDIVENHTGYHFGKFKLVGVMAIVPFSRGIFLDESDVLTSSQLLKKYMLSDNASWGVGSNLISDLFVDFGLVGVILGMLVLGGWASYVQCNTENQPDNIKWVLLYFMTAALFSEIARYTFDFPIRNIIWTLIIIYLYRVIISIKIKMFRR